MALKLNERPWSNIVNEEHPFSNRGIVIRRNTSKNVRNTKRQRESEELKRNTNAVRQSWHEQDERERKEAEEEEIGELEKESKLRENHARAFGERYRGKKFSQPCKYVIGEHKGEECWAYEYVDPLTGNTKRPHTCPYIHPGQQGWHDEWYTNPRFVPKGTGSWRVRGGKRNITRRKSSLKLRKTRSRN